MNVITEAHVFGDGIVRMTSPDGTVAIHDGFRIIFRRTHGDTPMPLFPGEPPVKIFTLKRRRMPIIAYSWPSHRHGHPQFQSLN